MPSAITLSSCAPGVASNLLDKSLTGFSINELSSPCKYVLTMVKPSDNDLRKLPISINLVVRVVCVPMLYTLPVSPDLLNNKSLGYAFISSVAVTPP